MPSYREVYPSLWLKAEAIVGKAPRVTTERVTLEKLYNPSSKKNEDRLIVKFKRTETRLICNQTHCKALEAISGTDDFTRWGNLDLILTVGKASNGKDTIVISAAALTEPRPAPSAEPAPAAAKVEPSPSIQNSHLDDIDMGMGGDTGAGDDDLWDTEPDTLVHGQGQTPENAGARPEASAESLVHGQEQPANPSARPADPAGALGARPEQCPHCHAPAGKPHAKKCPLANPGARPEGQPENAGARPGTPEQKPVHGQAPQPANPGARPVQQPLSPEERMLQAAAGLMTSSTLLSFEAKEVMRKVTNADSDSSIRMTKQYLEALITMLEGTLVLTDNEANMLLAALVGYPINAKRMPGQLVHSHLVKPLRNEDDAYLEALMEIANACREIEAREWEAA